MGPAKRPRAWASLASLILHATVLAILLSALPALSPRRASFPIGWVSLEVSTPAPPPREATTPHESLRASPIRSTSPVMTRPENDRPSSPAVSAPNGSATPPAPSVAIGSVPTTGLTSSAMHSRNGAAADGQPSGRVEPGAIDAVAPTNAGDVADVQSASLPGRSPSDDAEGGRIVRPARPRGGYQVRPAYPNSARHAGVQGTTLLRVRVEADGTVGEITVQQSAGHPDLDQAAADAVRRWKFEPAVSGNGDATTWVLIPVEFRLKRADGG